MGIGDAFEKHSTAMFMGVCIKSNSPILPIQKQGSKILEPLPKVI